MDFSQDHFALFGLPRRYALDNAELDRLYREVQARVHPDKFAHLGDAERRLAMQWATRINEAYQTLRQPLPRAKYLLSLAGVEVERERKMSSEFLMQQMEWREAVAEARAALAVGELEALHARLKREMAGQYLKLAAQLDEPDAGGAADLLRQLMFQEKLLADIDDALAAVES
ncbi:MAG TPA: Fe-S protein assembly co-chaperone HscB [Rhodocyclaceae bacterium]|nr:Fe-S protein assembly co-chaperone HscB [Rhodocyclaceae bacterium]